MWDNFRYTLRWFWRWPALLFWPLAFPIIMSLLFNFMFANMDESYALDPVAVGYVRDAAYDDALGLDDTLHSVDGDEGEDHYLDLVEFSTEADAVAAARSGDVACFVKVVDGKPQLHLRQSNLGEESRMNLAAVTAILDGYIRVWDEVATVAKEDPGLLLGDLDFSQLASLVDEQTGTIPDEAVRALADQALAAGAEEVVGSFMTDKVSTRRLKLTRSDPDPSARYFYALLGMAAGLGAALAYAAVTRLQPNFDALGARRTMAGLPRWKLLVSALAASWVAEFACLLVGFGFMRLVLHVNFGDRLLPCLGAMAASSLAFCALGAAYGTLTRLPETLITAFTMTCSFFAGLYGTASQRVADAIAIAHPTLALANPVRTTAQAFYALLYYDNLDRYARYCGVLLIIAAVFTAIAVVRMRRQSYASL